MTEIVQPDLFEDVSKLCAQGRHPRLIDATPVDHGDCVNVDSYCAYCHRVVATRSWTKEAWEDAQRKRKR